MAIVTPGYIDRYLSDSNKNAAQFIGRALVVLFNNQTEDEKQVNDTNQNNGIGFTGADAHSGCISAKYFLKHGTLQDWQIERWTKRNRHGQMRIAKYWRQLDRAAQQKRAQAQAPAKPELTPDEIELRDALIGEGIDPFLKQKARHAEWERAQEAEVYRKKYAAEHARTPREYLRMCADPRSQ